MASARTIYQFLLALCAGTLSANVPAPPLPPPGALKAAARAAGELTAKAVPTADRPLPTADSSSLPPFSRFQIILDRQPFGRAPDPAAAVAAPADGPTEQQQLAEQQKLAKQINMSGITINPDGRLYIGFTDLGAKPPVNYYLAEGGSGGGWTVLEADCAEETATIEKDGIQLHLKLGKGLVTGAPSPATAPIPTALASVRHKGKPADAAASSEPSAKSKEPAFKTATEQLMGMIASVPLGMSAPPLPVSDDDDLAEDMQKALATPIVINEDDNEGIVAHKESVALIKEDMRVTLETEGGTATSYLKRLQERQREAEQKRREESERLRSMVETAAREKVMAELANINTKLEEEGIVT
ncbi:MAG: hypothetical protein PHR35_21130, partial [Kiritimatiellae bacterium]|nr:hypothetical protein [Kiritimatiellia bacterium]